jgi:hypothetical protein
MAPIREACCFRKRSLTEIYHDTTCADGDEAELYPKVRAAIYDFYKQAYEDYHKGFLLGMMLYGGGDISQILPKVVDGTELDQLVTFQKMYYPPAPRRRCQHWPRVYLLLGRGARLGVLLRGDGVAKAEFADIAYPPSKP